MKTRLTLLLGLLIAVTPASVAAQTESPLPEAIDPELIGQLCAATSDDAAELEGCIGSVEAALQEMIEAMPEEEQTLLDEIASTVDDRLDDLRDVDLQAAFDDAIESAQGFDVDEALAGAQEAVDQAITDAQTAIDELELPSDVDIQGALEEAVAEALTTAEEAVAEALTAAEEVDFQAAVDDALAEAQAAIDEADLQGTVDDAVMALEDAVADAQAIVAEAQAWAQENREAVCRGSSVSLGTTVGIAVFAVTGVEWLGLQAFWAAERFSNGFCGDLVGDE